MERGEPTLSLIGPPLAERHCGTSLWETAWKALRACPRVGRAGLCFSRRSPSRRAASARGGSDRCVEGSSWVKNSTVSSSAGSTQNVRARRPAPAVLAHAGGHLARRRVDDDRKAEPEADSRPRPVLRSGCRTGPCPPPRADGCASCTTTVRLPRMPHAVELAVTQQHLGEPVVVRRRRHQPAAARERASEVATRPRPCGWRASPGR